MLTVASDGVEARRRYNRKKYVHHCEQLIYSGGKKNKNRYEDSQIYEPTYKEALPVTFDPLSQRRQFRAMQYNVEFFSYKRTRKKKIRPKPIWAIKKVARAIRDINPDVGLITEMMDYESCLKLIADELASQYDCHISRGNDELGLKIALITKKGLNVTTELKSHADVTWVDPVTHAQEPLFSRDLPVWFIRDADSGELLLIVAGTHAKSKRPRDGDPESTRLRTAQIKGSVEILKDIETSFPGVPVIWAGDFNADVRNSPDVASARKSFTDAFNVAAYTVPEKDRITHSYHPNGGGVSYAQLDTFFVNDVLRSRILEAGIYSYKNDKGQPYPLPVTFNQRRAQGSDHRPSFIDVVMIPQN